MYVQDTSIYRDHERVSMNYCESDVGIYNIARDSDNKEILRY